MNVRFGKFKYSPILTGVSNDGVDTAVDFNTHRVQIF